MKQFHPQTHLLDDRESDRREELPRNKQPNRKAHLQHQVVDRSRIAGQTRIALAAEEGRGEHHDWQTKQLHPMNATYNSAEYTQEREMRGKKALGRGEHREKSLLHVILHT
jgi:hypothetical protein